MICQILIRGEIERFNIRNINNLLTYTEQKLLTFEEKKVKETDDKGRLGVAEIGAGVLIADLREIIKYTKNLPLEEIMVEALEMVIKLQRRLKRFQNPLI